ncbi:hypothetical protein SCARD494_13061 [Seiridium cardinale]
MSELQRIATIASVGAFSERMKVLKQTHDPQRHEAWWMMPTAPEPSSEFQPIPQAPDWPATPLPLPQRLLTLFVSDFDVTRIDDYIAAAHLMDEALEDQLLRSYDAAARRSAIARNRERQEGSGRLQLPTPTPLKSSWTVDDVEG